LEVASETGIIGLTVFLLMVGLAFRAILTARRKFQEAHMDDYANMITGFAIAFGGYMLSALFVHAAYPRYFYLLLGIAYALPVIFEQMQIDQENQLMHPDLPSRYELAKNESSI
jgi:O-antigen ligase